jgi:hypothetical protein
MRSSIRTYLLFLILLLLCFPTSCSSLSSTSTLTGTSTSGMKLNVGDGGFLSGEPCGPPCFWGIIPGITTDDETNKLLESAGVQTSECKYSQRQNPDVNVIRCGPVGLGYEIGIAIDTTGVVKDLGFAPEPPFSLGDVIAKYGNPDAVSVGRLSVTLVPPDIGIRIYYDHLQAELSIPDQKGSAEIRADYVIDGVLYSNAQSYEKSRKSSQPWHGFGEYAIDP